MTCKCFHIDKGFYHILGVWAEEHGLRSLEKKVYDNKEIGKELEKLALEEELVKNPTVEIDTEDERVLSAEYIKKEYGVISDCLLMRKLKCTRSEACAILRALGTRESTQHKRNYQT